MNKSPLEEPSYCHFGFFRQSFGGVRIRLGSPGRLRQPPVERAAIGRVVQERFDGVDEARPARKVAGEVRARADGGGLGRRFVWDESRANGFQRGGLEPEREFARRNSLGFLAEA